MLENRQRFCQWSLALAITLLSGMAWAVDNAAPVESLTAPSSDYSRMGAVDTSSLPLPQRVSRLEQQLDNLIQMNLPEQIAELQQEIQKLTGQLQEQAHQFDQLSRQQQHVEALPPVPVPPPAPTPVPTPAVPNARSGKVNLPPVEATPPPASSINQTPSIDSAAYESAFNLLANKQFDKAAEAFVKYIRQHPDGQFIANAHYWLGEIYLQQRNLTQSELEFNYVIQQYPTSGKVADAQLKLAILHAQQGKTEQARQELKALMTRYPGSTAAQLASVQLQQLNSNSR